MVLLNELQAWAQDGGDLFDTRDSTFCAVFCTCHFTLPLPPLPTTARPGVEAQPKDG